MISITMTLAAIPLLAAGVQQDAQFEPPVQITTAGNTFSDIIYPTPVLYDIDEDGQQEMVIGDLIGYLRVCEYEGDAPGLDWSKAEHVQADGKPLKLNNW